MPSTSRPTLADNNLDLVRFVLASMVLLVHAHVLSGAPALAVLSAAISSDLAVKAFFVVSGLLVTMSFERSSTLVDYAERRARRIYPAYATVVVVAAVGLVATSSVGAIEYFTSAAWWRYLGANLAFANFLQPTLPGVFDGQIVPNVNGALWTLKIEVMFYATVPVLVLAIRRWGPWPVLGAVYAVSEVYAAWMGAAAERTGRALYDTLAHQLPGQLSYFASGAAIYYGFGSVSARWPIVAGVGVLCLTADRIGGLAALEPVWIAAIVALAGFSHHFGSVGRRGDLSYGIYVIHFPVIQVLVGRGLFGRSPVLGLAVTIALVLGLALAMWRWIERPWLRRSSHYRTAGSRV